MKLEAASPAPTCASFKSDKSMDRPIMFSQRLWQESSSPAPTCMSMNSDKSMDRPTVFSREEEFLRMKLEAASPAPTCASLKSDKSMDRPIMFSQRLWQESSSPAPTCMSMNSDKSMDRPTVFSREEEFLRMKLEAASPAPTCASLKSDKSMDRPIMFNQRLKQESPSPAPTCMSMNSDKSMDRPIMFSREEECVRALSASLLTEDHFRCPVCTDVLKDPVSIPCGHSYCKTCIQNYWTKPTLQNSYCCPQCRKRFRTRPALNQNSALAKVVQKLQQARFSPALPDQCYAGPGDVACDFCTGRKLRAVKSCLTCSASYCETHVKQHYTVAALQRHTLVEVTGDLEQRLCKLHQRALEVFCKTDRTFICLICTMEEHKEHDTVLAKNEDPTAEIILLNSSEERKQMIQLLKDNKELTAKVERAETELAFLVKRFCRGLEEANALSSDFTSDFVEVSALGRSLDLGMLYNCHDDSFNSDVFLWDADCVSSMRLSLPRFYTNMKILEGDSLQDRLKALDLSTALRASVVSGLVEVAGGAAFLKHPTQSQLQDRVTLHYRTSTRLDMLSHRLLQSGASLSVTNQSSTHVVAAVLYGVQAFFVFDNTSESKAGTTELRSIVKKMTSSSCATECSSSLTESEQASCLLYDCAVYLDGNDVKNPVNFNTSVNVYSSLQKLLGPQSERAVPLKVWLYPLKNLDQSSPHVVRDISEVLLNKAEKVLKFFERTLRNCQDMLHSSSSLHVVKWFPSLKEDISQCCALLQQYKSEFQRELASCIKTIRDIGEEGEERLRDLLHRNEQSLFSLQNIHQWLQNEDAEVKALNECKAANTQHKQPPLSFGHISQKILSDLHLFLSSKEADSDAQQIKFIAASVPDQEVPGSSIRLYQSGGLVIHNVKLEVNLEAPEIITVRPTSVTLKLQRLQSSKTKSTDRYRVEYRALSCKGWSHGQLKWSNIEICNTEENCVIMGFTPEVQYQLRYAVIDGNSMSDYSRITEFQTLPRATPGQLTVKWMNGDSLCVSWPRAEADGDSPVLHYMVEYKETGLEGWQSILTEGPECECTITLPYSTCYRLRVSAVYEEGDASKPSEETEVPVETWKTDLSERKSSLFLEMLKLQTVKKPVELRGWSDEESEVRSFLQCLPYISQLRISSSFFITKHIQVFLDLFSKAAECEIQTGEKTLELLTSVCTYSSFPYGDIQSSFPYRDTHRSNQCDFLLDLFSHVKNYETQTGRTVLPALQPVYQSAPAVWIINLSERKSSLFLEVLKLQTVKKPVELRGWTDEESEVRSFLQCLPYISQLRFRSPQSESDEWRKRVNSFLLDLCLQAALHQKDNIQTAVEELMSCACGGKEDFLLDLFSHVKNYETQTGRTVLPALQPVYQSAPAEWIINLSERKSSLFLEVLKLQTVKKPVKLRGWSDEESEVRSFLQCLPYISQLRFRTLQGESAEWRKRVNSFLLDLCLQAALYQKENIQTTVEELMSCSYGDKEEFLLDLFSHVKNYETQTGRSVLPALQPVYQSAPAVWIINLSERKSSLFLEVLKLQTVKKPVKLRGWSDEESEVRSFLQCLPYISQLRFCWSVSHEEQKKKSAFHFLLNLSVAAAAESDSATGERFTELLTSVCSYPTFPFHEDDPHSQWNFMLDLYSYVKNYETQTDRSVLPALQPVYQSAPAEWIINLSERKSSLFLEVLKLQTVKKPVELWGWPDEESEVRSFLQCLPYISQLRFFEEPEEKMSVLKFLLSLSAKVSECDTATKQSFIELLTSMCRERDFPFNKNDYDYEDEDDVNGALCDFLLDLFSHVKNYETQTDRSVLPALQPVYQSAPAVWIINLSERKSSLFLEVLKLQTVKKPVELWGWPDEESEVRSFLQCLPYISQLRFFEEPEVKMSVLKFLLSLSAKVSECDTDTKQSFIELLTSMCRERDFPFNKNDYDYEDEDDVNGALCDFLLDLFSHVKNYETQTGRTVLPALQPVYQSAPAVWIINLSGGKSSLFLEVLKLQTEKKPVELSGWSDEESEVRSFLQCLPYISQLRFHCFVPRENNKQQSAFQFLLNLSVAAAESDSATGESFTELLTSVCSYSTFPFDDHDNEYNTDSQCDFLLDLCSYVKNYETQTGRSVFPALQPVYQSAPAVWIINLSERKSSLFLEVLKLQTVKKPVELTGWSDEESEVRSFLQCLPYISQLSGAEQCVPSACKVLHSRGETEQVAPLLQALDFTLSLEGKLLTSSCRALGRVLGLSASNLKLTLNPQAISLRGTRHLFRYITHLHTLRLSGVMVMRTVRALRAAKAPVPVTIEELSLIHSTTQQSKKELSRVLSSLASLLRLWNVQCLNLTEHTMEVQSLTVLLCHQGSLTIRLSNKRLQKLVVVVNEAQDEELTRGFLQKVGGDLTSCSLNWELIHYFLQYHTVTVDFRKSNIKQQNIRELVSVLDRVQLRRLTSSFVLPIIREIYETGSAHCVSSLLCSIKNCINLNSRELDSVHCAALRFTLQHCTAVSLSLLWTSIPEGELESIVPLLSHVSHLSVDRMLLLRLLRCCSVSVLQQGAAAVLLSALQHRLDFSCSSTLDLTEHTQTHTLSSEDCRVISMTIQRARTPTQLILQDCEIEETGVEQLFTILHKVTLHCSKALLLQFLSLVPVGTELDCVRRVVALSQALGEELDLSQTQLDLQVCRSLALVLEHSEGLTELDLSHCQLTDHCLDLLLPHLHKINILDLSDNYLTDVSAKRIYDIVSTNSNIQTVRLFSNRITERLRFLSDRRFEIW
ncbi:uncharacterized protein LOC118817098 isoform X9 [Colossoma macropomum]|uniref:uncharacterized protein LOC118817098 isoform X9 n=1 Tax=Colossoma macropomum TaxID=42526 RepID=UPI001864CA25|nr:uncharacterized protein LOC118817098 isoform X9 [Colossoma macropomum]